MSIIRQLWNWVIERPGDIALAFILAIIFAVFVDFLQPASRVRDLIRHIKNYLAESSDAEIRKRIMTTETYRKQLVVYMESDKAHYLAVLQHIFAILSLLCGGAAVVLIGSLSPIPNQYNLLAILPFVLGLLVAISGIMIASWNSRSKLSDKILKLDKEISALQAKLDKRVR